MWRPFGRGKRTREAMRVYLATLQWTHDNREHMDTGEFAAVRRRSFERMLRVLEHGKAGEPR